MWYWLYIFALSSLIPITLISLGTLFTNKPPKERNLLFGYRTRMSMKNDKTWEFAHRYCGKLWLTAGLWMLPVVFALMLWFKDSPDSTLLILGTVLSLTGLIPMLFSVALTEFALRKYFYNDGTPRNGDKK